MYKVLIVDDKALIRKGISSSIDWQNLKIELSGEAENGKRALEIIKQKNIDILITDIRMPEMDGIELLKNINEINSDMVKIVISGFDEFDYAKKALKYGSIDYIMKPIDPCELNTSLKKACSLLDKHKAQIQTTENMLRDLFFKTIKEVTIDTHGHEELFEKYFLGESRFCILVIKSNLDSLEYFKKFNGLSISSYFIQGISGADIVVFWGKRNIISNESINLTALSSVRKFQTSTGSSDIYWGIGSVVEDISQLSSSYKIACEATLNCMLGIENESKIKRYHENWLDEFEKELIANVTSGNINQVQQILVKGLEQLFSFKDISMDNIRNLYRRLCFDLIKLHVDFNNELYDFLDKLGMPEYLLKFDSLECLNEIIKNFYNFAAEKYLQQLGGKSSLVSTVKKFIDTNYASDISLNKLAELFHINPSYLTRIFKEEEGFSINEYIAKVRVENAKQILESGKINIQKISETVGYVDSTYFFKVFKRVTGMTPREYISKKQ